jgi:hypothetical protein
MVLQNTGSPAAKAPRGQTTIDHMPVEDRRQGVSFDTLSRQGGSSTARHWWVIFRPAENATAR